MRNRVYRGDNIKDSGFGDDGGFPHGFKAWVMAVLIGLFAHALVGCSPQGDSSADSGKESPFSGLKLTLMVPSTYGIADQIKVVTDNWAAESAAEVEVLERSLLPGAEVSGEVGKSVDTIFAIPVTSLPVWEAEGITQFFPDERASSSVIRWDGIFLGPHSTIAARAERRIAVPIACPSLKLFYRQDLFDRAGLESPRSWEEYLALVNTQEDWTNGLPIVEPWKLSFRPTMFAARAIGYAKHPENYSLFFDVADGKVLIQTPGFVEGLEKSKQILDKIDPRSFELSPGDCRRLIMNGEAAMAIGIENGRLETQMAFGPGWTADEPNVPRNLNSSVGRDFVIGVSSLPGGERVYDNSRNAWVELDPMTPNRATLGGFSGMALVLGKTSSKVTAEALAHLAGRLAVEQPSMSFPDPCKTFVRAENYQDVQSWVGSDLAHSERQQVISVIRDDLDTENYACELLVVGRDRFRSALNTALTQSILEKVPAQDALKSAQIEWEAIRDEIGLETVRESYRRTIGLRFIQ